MTTKWIKEIEQKYRSGIANAFIVTGNIGDYASQTYKVETYIAAFFNQVLKIDDVAIFDVANGTKYYKKAKNNESNSGKDGENLTCVCNNLISIDKNENDKEITKGYIFMYPELLFPSENRILSDENKKDLITLHETLNSGAFMESKNIIVFLTESVKDLHPMLISSNTRTDVVDMTLPDYDERLNFIDFKVKDNDCAKYFNSITLPQFAQLTAGLSLMNIEDIILNAEFQKNLQKKMILDRKKELIQKQYGNIIEIYDTDGFSLVDFAGQEQIKEYFQDVVIDAIKDNNINIVPKGVLLMGPPGTGKTYFSRCLAGDAGINFVEFKMSKILDKWVGEAEKNLEKAFAVFRALAPVGVFIDELDQALCRGGEQDGNSVNKNMFGMFLSELSKPENRGKIVWIGATNYPNKLDEALKRPGRFDKKIPFFAPLEDERAKVFEIHLKNTKFALSDDIDTMELAKKTDGYTQAEIENIIVKALELTMRKKSEKITQAIILQALGFMLSAQNKKIQEMEDIALLECNDLEFLPDRYRERQKKLIEAQDNIKN